MVDGDDGVGGGRPARRHGRGGVRRRRGGGGSDDEARRQAVGSMGGNGDIDRAWSGLILNLDRGERDERVGGGCAGVCAERVGVVALGFRPTEEDMGSGGGWPKSEAKRA